VSNAEPFAEVVWLGMNSVLNKNTVDTNRQFVTVDEKTKFAFLPGEKSFGRLKIVNEKNIIYTHSSNTFTHICLKLLAGLQ